MSPKGFTRERALERIERDYRRRMSLRDEADRKHPNHLARTDRIKWSNYRRMFERNGLLPLGGRDILDIGCQWGTWLALCREARGQDEKARLCGVELMEDWARRGRKKYPFIDLRCGSGDRTPFEDASFDLVHQSMVFSSVPDADLREGLATEMRRLVRPGGYVIWYDFFFNPVNSETVGMTLRQVQRYFVGWELLDRDRVTLAPPLARLLQKVWGGAVDVLSQLKILNFHHLMLLKKPDTNG